MKTQIVIRSSVLPVILVAMLSAGCDKPKQNFKCLDSIGCVIVASDEPLKIGILQALSGKVASLGQEQVKGIELSIDEWNGKILDHFIALQTEDTGCSAEGGANAVLKMIADPQTVAILGTTCSDAAATAAHAMSDAGLTMISGNNSAPFLTSICGKRAPDWHSGYFRTAPNDENAGKAAAIYVFRELGIRKVAMINDGDIYTVGLTDGFGHAFQKLGGKIVLTSSVNKGDKEMQPVLTAVINSGAQFLFFPLFQPEGNHILLQAKKMAGFENIVLMSDGSLIEESFIEAVQENGKGMYFVGPHYPDNSDSDAMNMKYEAKYNVQPSSRYYLSAYDAANLLFLSIRKAAFQLPDGSLHICRQSLRDVLYATKNFKGVIGSLTCDEFGDCAFPVFNVLRLYDPAAGLEGLYKNVMFSYTPEK